ncbi:MAG: hypothetical protein QM773_01830 [Hyphomonadaceae bacterium]
MEIEDGSLPLTYDWHVEHADFVDEIDLKSKRGSRLFVAAYDLAAPVRESWKPAMVVAQTYEPCGLGFNPGFLIAPETKRLFIGAGTRILAYDLSAPARLWEDKVDCGFWRWGRYDEFIWMAAELEFAVWSNNAQKLWATFVEPPWEHTFHNGSVTLDVMGKTQTRRMGDGRVVY